jgi:hypothetical protein
VDQRRKAGLPTFFGVASSFSIVLNWRVQLHPKSSTLARNSHGYPCRWNGNYDFCCRARAFRSAGVPPIFLWRVEGPSNRVELHFPADAIRYPLRRLSLSGRKWSRRSRTTGRRYFRHARFSRREENRRLRQSMKPHTCTRMVERAMGIEPTFSLGAESRQSCVNSGVFQKGDGLAVGGCGRDCRKAYMSASS